MHLRPELVSSEHIECKGGQLLGHIAGPLVPVRGDGHQRINHDTCEVNVANYNHVVLAEKGQLHEIHGRLPVRASSLAEVLDGPHDREEHSAAADHIDQQQHLLPGDPGPSIRPGLINHHLRNVGHDLQRDDHHKDLLLSVSKVRLEEWPAGADEHNEREQRDPLEEAEDVEEHVPAVRRASALDVWLVLGLGEQVDRLEHEHGEHEVVDPEHGGALAQEYGDPAGGERGVGDAEEAEDGRERGGPRGEVGALAGGRVDVVHGGADVHGDLEPPAEAVGEDERVLPWLGDGEGGGEGWWAGDLDAGGVGWRPEAVEGVGELDEVGLERAGDVEILQLAEDVHPGVERGEEESQLGEVELGGGRRVEGDAGDVELEDARVGEPELVERDDAPRVAPDHRLPDLRRRRGGEEEEEEGERRRGGERRGGGHRSGGDLGGGGIWDLGFGDFAARVGLVYGVICRQSERARWFGSDPTTTTTRRALSLSLSLVKPLLFYFLKRKFFFLFK